MQELRKVDENDVLQEPSMSQPSETAIEIGSLPAETRTTVLSAGDGDDQTTSSCFECVLAQLIYIVICPFHVFYVFVAWFLCVANVSEEESGNHAPPASDGRLFEMMKEVEEAGRRVRKVPKFLRSRLVMILLTWLTVNLSVPGLRHMLVHGTKLWKWTLLIAVVLCGYRFISMVTRFLLHLLCKNRRFKKAKNVVYFAKGMRTGVNLVLLFSSVLVVWLLFFQTNRGFKNANTSGSLVRNGTMTLLILTVGAGLWMLKSLLLLKWEADAIYERFRGRILNAGFQCFFLGHICGWHLGLFKPKTTEHKHDVQVASDNIPQAVVQHRVSPQNLARADSRASDKEIRNYKEKTKQILRINKESTLNDIKKMATFFIELCRASSREDDGTSDVLQLCRKINPGNAPNLYLTVELLTRNFELQKKDAELLFLKLVGDSSYQIPYKKFEKYMVKAQRNCVALGHTLLDAKEVVQVLNRVITGSLIVVVVITWLLLTNIASLKLLIVIASPLLAVSFVSGNVCKMMFDGIIFSFISHPFDVGDLCIIDDTELEVKHIGVLSTTFTVIGTNQEAFYPNSALATKCIINRKGEPDTRDHIEIELEPTLTKSNLDDLRKYIKRLFEQDKGNKYEKAHSIVVNQIGKSVIMGIEFCHVMSIHETTHSQCLRKKRERKSEILLHIKELIEGTTK